jgi:hypothetical protein
VHRDLSWHAQRPGRRARENTLKPSLSRALQRALPDRDRRDGHTGCIATRWPRGDAGAGRRGRRNMTVDWQTLFEFSKSPLELIVRGSAVYWFLFLVFRVVMRREVGAIGVADVLLLVLVADAASNAMHGGYRSVSEGMVLVATIIGWAITIDWLAYRFPAARRVLEPRVLPLIRDGRVVHRNLRREFVSIEELEGKLRQQGVDDVTQVRAAYLESDGKISVLTRRRKP